MSFLTVATLNSIAIEVTLYRDIERAYALVRRVEHTEHPSEGWYWEIPEDNIMWTLSLLERHNRIPEIDMRSGVFPLKTLMGLPVSMGRCQTMALRLDDPNAVFVEVPD